MGGMGGASFLNKPFGEQKTILHVHVDHVQHRPQGVQACTSLQESGTVLLASANKLIFLDSLIPEVYCMNKLLWFEKMPKSYAEASVMQVDDILHTKDL